MSVHLARHFRSNLTRHEARMWKWLKTLRAEGYHFRRQAPFRSYFLDFVCFSQRLVIEIDGDSHFTDRGAARDALRDAVLQGEGFAVLRITNHNIDIAMQSVCETVLARLQGRE